MDMLKNIFLAGVGALSLSRERAQEIVTQLIKQGKIREREGRQLVDEMMKKASDLKRNTEQEMNRHVNQAYQKLNVATLAQLRKMERRVQELEKKLAAQRQAAKGGRAAGSRGAKRARAR